MTRSNEQPGINPEPGHDRLDVRLGKSAFSLEEHRHRRLAPDDLAHLRLRDAIDVHDRPQSLLRRKINAFRRMIFILVFIDQQDQRIQIVTRSAIAFSADQFSDDRNGLFVLVVILDRLKWNVMVRRATIITNL